MAGRTSYYGGIVLDGLVFHIDAAKQESYAKRGLRYTQNGNTSLFVDFADTSKSPSTQNASGSVIDGATFSNFAPYHLSDYTSPYWYNPGNNTGIGTSYGNIEFDGVDDYINFGDTPDITGCTDITVSAWFYVNKFRPSLPATSVVAGRYSNITPVNGWDLGYNNDGTVWFGGRESSAEYIQVTASLLIKQANMNGVTANGGWYNAVGVKKGNNWSISVMDTNVSIDKTRAMSKSTDNHTGIRSVTAGLGNVPFGANNLYAGKSQNSYFMNGRLMTLSVYNRALSLAEINKNYNSFSKRILKLSGCSDVTIGSQIWTGCNLNVSTYRNGDTIPQVTDPVAWANLTTGAWCYYNNDPATGAIYGKLYNWYAVNDPRGLAPTGYHIPSYTELNTLTTYLGGPVPTAAALKEVGTTHWAPANPDATNSSGFTAIPGGYINNLGSSSSLTFVGAWWSTTQFDSSNSWYMSLGNNPGGSNINNMNKKSGLSIRLIKD